ncbi:MAG TPA: type II toxin-antitoxin system Phd/YefM family antitoxin [Terriglobales bacterium]|nr:type II toxin-antitoxin system Phd/YefM family antitoxin [Terriglobales bacterium]
MKKMPVSEAKARFLAVVNQVSSTGEGVVVTKRGKPLVKVIPFRPEKDKPFFDRLKDIASLNGEITKPIIPAEDWEFD